MMDIEVLTRTLVGKRVVRVDKSKYKRDSWLGRDVEGSVLVLDDGTTLGIWESSQDCCAGAYGEWVLDADHLDAAITNVTYETSCDPANDSLDNDEYFAKITVLHNQNVIALADCYANNGNGGYYYSILSLRISVPGASPVDMTVVEA